MVILVSSQRTLTCGRSGCVLGAETLFNASTQATITYASGLQRTYDDGGALSRALADVGARRRPARTALDLDPTTANYGISHTTAQMLCHQGPSPTTVLGVGSCQCWTLVERQGGPIEAIPRTKLHMFWITTPALD